MADCDAADWTVGCTGGGGGGGGGCTGVCVFGEGGGVGRLNLSGLLLLRGEGLCRTNIEIMFNTLLNIRYKSCNQFIELDKGKNKTKQQKTNKNLNSSVGRLHFKTLQELQYNCYIK